VPRALTSLKYFNEDAPHMRLSRQARLWVLPCITGHRTPWARCRICASIR
jgi:hypothetical protein